MKSFLEGNVRREPVFSVMAAGWFCEVRLNWESGGCENDVLNKNWISTNNHLRRRILNEL